MKNFYYRTMDAASFKKLINKYFSPNIRELGWKGSGFNFYELTENHVINIFGIQGSWYGGSVCCETAIHFDFLPELSGKTDPKKISYASCLIRQRLSPTGEGDYHWNFKKMEEDNIKSVNEIWKAFTEFGLDFYNDFSNFPHPFDLIRPEDINPNNRKLLDKYFILNFIDFIWLLKEINILLGKNDVAKNFSDLGIRFSIELHNELMNKTKSKKVQQDLMKHLSIRMKQFQ